MSGLTKLQLLKLRSLPWWDQIKRKERWSPAEHVQTAERLAKEHGILPRPSWLCKNGFSALDAYMRKYPELFAHIPQQESLYSLADQHVQTAEWLAKEHNGVRPSLKWLLKNG